MLIDPFSVLTPISLSPMLPMFPSTPAAIRAKFPHTKLSFLSFYINPNSSF